MYYRTCPYCGANLDPGEKCDCAESTGGAAAAGNSGTDAGYGRAGHAEESEAAMAHYIRHADSRKGRKEERQINGIRHNA